MSSALGSRGVRWLLIAGAGLGAISLFLLATATANTRLFAGSYDVLLLLNTVMVVLLMALVGYQLWRLRRKLRKGVFGSRLALRLVLLFALVAVLPGALVYAVSVQFLGKSIESWFDDKVLSSSVQYRITWNALTRQYRVSSGLYGQTLYTLQEIERFLSRVTSRPVARRDQLQPGARYDAALRLRLDVNQLPKPFQVDALTSREWSLQSDWHRWGFTA